MTSRLAWLLVSAVLACGCMEGSKPTPLRRASGTPVDPTAGPPVPPSVPVEEKKEPAPDDKTIEKENPDKAPSPPR